MSKEILKILNSLLTDEQKGQPVVELEFTTEIQQVISEKDLPIDIEINGVANPPIMGFHAMSFHGIEKLARLNLSKDKIILHPISIQKELDNFER